MKRTLFILAAAALVAAVAAAQQNGTGNVDNGKRLFLRDGCWECHGYAGQGGGAGARIGATTLSLQGFVRYVRRPTATMPAFTDKVVPDKDLTDIYGYLKSMPPVKTAKDVPLLNQIKNQ
jgi:mono/diheme cytochrome c family protein